jgi:hypothetical protein
MGKKLIVLFLTLSVLAVLSGGYVVGGMNAYSNFQKTKQATTEHCGGQVPVYICVQAPTAIFSAFYPAYVSTQNPLFTVKYSSSMPLTLVISVSIVNFTQTFAQTVNATSAAQAIQVIPPLLNASTLRQWTHDTTTTLHVQVSDTHNHPYYVSDSHILLYSRWLMQWTRANRLLIGAWVTPDDPAVKALVQKSIQHLSAEPPTPPPAMVGYADASQQQVIDQVDAIYDALRLDYHIHYVQASVPYNGPGDTTVATEQIKLPFEVLQQQSGMCIELTLLLASTVESVGLHAEIVITPGHAFLGVAVTPDNKHFEYWDAAEVNNAVAADSDNIDTNNFYMQNAAKHTILDTILISDAQAAGIEAMI